MNVETLKEHPFGQNVRHTIHWCFLSRHAYVVHIINFAMHMHE